MSKFSTSAASDYLTSLPRKTHFNIFTSWHWIQVTYRDFKNLTVTNSKNWNKYTPRKRGLRRHLAWNIPIQTGNSIKSAFAVQEFAKRAHENAEITRVYSPVKDNTASLAGSTCRFDCSGAHVRTNIMVSGSLWVILEWLHNWNGTRPCSTDVSLEHAE